MRNLFPNWWQGILFYLFFILMLVVSSLIPLKIIKYANPDLSVSLSYFFYTILSLILLRMMYNKSKLNIRSQIKLPELKILLIVLLIVLIQAVIDRPLAMPIIYFNAVINKIPPDLSIQTIKASNHIYWINHISLFLIIAPLTEEIFFRGILLEQFLKQYSAYFSIIVVSILFALMHFGVTMVEIFLLSIVISIIYYLTHSLFLVIFYHIIFNLMVVYIIPRSYELTKCFIFSPWYLLFSLSGVLMIIFLLKKVHFLESKVKL